MIYRDPKGMNLVKLYVKMEGEHICVNEELCKLEYAKYKDTSKLIRSLVVSNNDVPWNMANTWKDLQITV